MIYIDPPYNTGNEFIYSDNYREGLDEYLRYTGQLSSDNTATSTNKDTSGRYHSNWLNMMSGVVSGAQFAARGWGDLCQHRRP